MSSNRSAKLRLIQLYGPECFIEKLHLRIEPCRHYTSKGQRKRMKQLTYHHILERRNGGRATVANGALLSAENHQWFHKQPEEDQRRMNKQFQEYKKSVAMSTAEIRNGEIMNVKNVVLEFPDPENCITIPVYDNRTVDIPDEEFTDPDYLQFKKQRNERIFKKFNGEER